MSSKTIVFSSLPLSAEELKAMEGASLTDPAYTAAFTAAALCAYPEHPEAAIEMLDYLKGPESVSAYEKQFLKDRFRGADYIARSYFEGASVQNGYRPSVPYRITVIEQPNSRSEENWMTLYLRSAGADSPRSIRLRRKPSTGQWFLNEQMLLAGIRVPAAEDPWA